MRYTTYLPPPSLTPYIRFFWVLESEVLEGTTYLHHSMADGCAEMIFHYKGHFNELLPQNKQQKSFSSGVHGQSQHCSRFRINTGFGIFGVYIFPHAIPILFGIPATAISDQMPDLHSLLGQEGMELEEQVMLAGDDLARMNLLTRLLEKRLSKKKLVAENMLAAIHETIRTKGQRSVKEMADKYCLSLRQYERKFKEVAGFSPKLYSRIIRFQSAVKEYPNKHRSLTEIAHSCGYYDQSHFIQDFKQFSGHSPHIFFSGQADGFGWMES